MNDYRMLRAGGFTGSKRIVRHLWRMSLALLIATLSFYPGQAKLFSRAIRDTNVLVMPHLFLIGAMVFWMYRMRVRRRGGQPAVVGNAGLEAAALVRAVPK